MAIHLVYSVLLSVFQLLTFLFPLAQPLCHGDEQLALLQFKESFIIDKNASADHLCANPKVDQWNRAVDCCTWEGVECDHSTGHVIGLNLSKSCLHGSIHSNSSLFRLVYLRKLNLAFNNFSYSEIPSAIGSLPRLKHLNLSYSSFSGQIPFEISKLSTLSTLDLSLNFAHGNPYEGLLELKSPDMSSLVRNLTRLSYLDLSLADVSSPVPSFLANFSSLRSFLCHNCKLFGTFPASIFRLPNLELLELSKNKKLSGHLPEFYSSSRLKTLSIWNTSFSGELPASMGNLLHSLEFFGASHCKFTGSLPPSLANLTKLFHLGLESNSFSGEIPSFLSNLTELKFLSLGSNSFRASEIPSFLARLVHLERLDLASSKFSGPFPDWLTNFTQLRFLDLSSNMLQGQLPSSITRLKQLEHLNVASNDFSGVVELDTFLELKSLRFLSLSFNTLSVLSKSNNADDASMSLPKLVRLRLASCNLTTFPNFLRHQDGLEILDLSLNQIHGLIPKWIWQMSRKTLLQINLSQNSLTGFEESPMILPWSSLVVFNLRNNMLKGSLPIPPFYTAVYLVSNNSLSGEISPLLCRAASLQVLDVSYNNLNGMIPQCLGNFSRSLQVLNLRNNKLYGPIPQNWTTGRNMLQLINLGRNNLEGQVPRPITSCKMLKYLDLGDNQINDTFPSWLRTLPNLEVLILRSNGFHGAIGTNDPQSDFLFPQLRILDFSNNGFTGPLPSEYFKRWKAMTNLNSKHFTYMHSSGVVFTEEYIYRSVYNYSMTLTNKGVNMKFGKVFEALAVIDLSCNKFQGEIPESVGYLKGLQLLNLSNNLLVGQIPSVMGSMSNLEALDMSQNELVEAIPQELTQLNFLSVFNVSHNNLTGRIPQGQQFQTFDHTSYDGNPGLCGNPLSKKCEDSKTSALPPSQGKEDAAPLSQFGWQVITLGYGIGAMFGMIMGHIAFKRKHDWFLKTFGKRQRRRPTRGGNRR